jgi:glycine cleavage system pyridoxal-binding protein P
MNFEPKNFEPTDYLPYDFANRRHIGPSPEEMEKMLETLGINDLADLIDQTIPKHLYPAVQSELALEALKTGRVGRSLPWRGRLWV